VITIQREIISGCINGVLPLLAMHWEEVALHKEKVQLDPDLDRYREFERSNALRIFTARDGEILIGYSVFIVQKHLHYNGCLIAANDVLFLHKEYRGGTTAGLRLIKESERMLREDGVMRCIWHIKPKNDWSAILARLGYEQEEIVMGKLL
jgi:hypothetical protein